MSYVVLARKWRPQTFADLVGQDHVATTLANSIALGRIAHAFLFTGVRGVGKTSSARILAKALNCETGPTATPCGVCSQCRDIVAGCDMDVIEIDAASNTGVDNIRDLQETLNYRPARDRFKVYIVDEVHMLSASAWNAFLKTLEEPPPHVKFIFATTEVHKVPATILSRCQRYDFKLISANEVGARVRHVLAAESIEAEDGAVSLIAREAAGSMRDAMSLLDQVIAWAGVGEGSTTITITTEGATRVLGVAARSILHRLATAVVGGDAGAAVEVVAELAESGFDVAKVARDFLSHLRDLVVAKVAPDGRGLTDVPDREKADLFELARGTSVEDLARLHLGLSRAFDEIMTGASPRASLEMALVRMARRPPLVPIDELLRRLGELERRLASAPAGAGSPSGGSGASSGAGGGRDPARSDTSHGGAGQGGAPQGGAAQGGAAQGGAAQGGAGQGPSPQRDVPQRDVPQRGAARESAPGPTGGAQRPGPEPPEHAPSPAQPRPGAATPSWAVPPPSTPPGSLPPASAPPQSAPPQSAPPQSAPPPASIPSSARGRPDPVSGPRVEVPTLAEDDPGLAAYRAIVAVVHARQPGIASVLEHAALVEASSRRLAVGFEQGSFLAAQLAEAHALAAVRDAARAELGPDVNVEIVAVGREGLGGTLAKRASEVLRARIAEAEQQVRDHPVVAAAIELLGAELREVHLAPDLASAATWERRGDR